VYFTKIAPNYINALTLRKNNAGIALTLCNIAPKKNYFFMAKCIYCAGANLGPIKAQNKIEHTLINYLILLKKQLFIPNKKIIIKIS